jgi:hypothetical protein
MEEREGLLAPDRTLHGVSDAWLPWVLSRSDRRSLRHRSTRDAYLNRCGSLVDGFVNLAPVAGAPGMGADVDQARVAVGTWDPAKSAHLTHAAHLHEYMYKNKSTFTHNLERVNLSQVIIINLKIDFLRLNGPRNCARLWQCKIARIARDVQHRAMQEYKY